MLMRQSKDRFGLTTFISRPVLLTAGGAVTGGIVTNWVIRSLAQAGIRLPGINIPAVDIVYQVSIPFVAANFVQRLNRNFAEGMVIGGVIMGLNSLMALLQSQYLAQQQPPKPTSEYLNYAPVRPVGAPITRLPQRQMSASYGASNIFGAGQSVYDSTPAFPTTAW
jgi:hypothetical protein